ncbi:MAG: uroporphyrinogen-III synthase [Oceanospirillaceae bacterium]
MMMNEKPLSGQSILVTRPEHKQVNLTKLLQQQGAQVNSLATLAIAPILQDHADYGRLKQHILDLDIFDIIICVSANAARFAGELIDQYWPQLPVRIKWYAIGDASAAALAKFDIKAEVAKDQQNKGHDSEALLAHPELQDVAAKKVLILKGTSGRELLSQTLHQRKALISEANLYNRLIPVYTDQQIKNTLYNSSLSAILITSGEALCNLMTIARGSVQQFDHKSLLNTLLIVPSTRVAQLASTQGYHRIKVATAADDNAMLAALLSVKGLEADNEKKN